MALTPTNIGANPQIPGIAAEAFIPDQLIAGNLKLVTENATLITGQNLKRGAVLGKITASGKFTLALSASSDGSQTPAAILVDDVDATSADKNCGVYVMGEFNANAVTFGTGITLASARAALSAQNIYLKSSISAADPS